MTHGTAQRQSIMRPAIGQANSRRLHGLGVAVSWWGFMLQVSCPVPGTKMTVEMERRRLQLERIQNIAAL